MQPQGEGANAGFFLYVWTKTQVRQKLRLLQNSDKIRNKTQVFETSAGRLLNKGL